MENKYNRVLKIISLVVLIISLIFLFIIMYKEGSLFKKDQGNNFESIYESEKNDFIIMPTTKVTINIDDKSIIENVEKFIADISIPTGYKLELIQNNNIQTNSIFFKVDPFLSDISKDGYKISVTDENIVIEVKKDSGLDKAIEELKYLMPKEIESKELVWSIIWRVKGSKILKI